MTLTIPPSDGCNVQQVFFFNAEAHLLDSKRKGTVGNRLNLNMNLREIVNKLILGISLINFVRFVTDIQYRILIINIL